MLVKINRLALAFEAALEFESELEIVPEATRAASSNSGYSRLFITRASERFTLLSDNSYVK